MIFDKDKKMNRITIKHAMVLITYTIALLWIMSHTSTVLKYFKLIIDILKPFLYGIALAFVFNIPLQYFMKILPSKVKKARKLLASLLSILSILLILTILIWIVLPQIVDNVMQLVNAFPGYIDGVVAFGNDLMTQGYISNDMVASLQQYINELGNMAIDLLKSLFPQMLGAAGSIASSLKDVILAFVVCAYITISKEKLIKQIKLLFQAFLSEKQNKWIVKITKLTSQTFHNFVTGQLLEAVIIAILCYIGCLILKFPYAPIISVLIGVTNMIPIFGAIMGVMISALLVAMVNPIQALFFIIFGIALQQFESNLIYPRVVGNSVGLSGLWVLFAITIGGGLFGFSGMILGLPIFSIIYSLLKEATYKRIKAKKSSS